MRRSLRDALASGRRVIGTFVKLPTVDSIELIASAGYDFAVVDLEHSALVEADALALVRHASLVGLPALVRVPNVDTALVNRLLENGAAGIQLSMVRHVAQAEALVAATRYAPTGGRSVSLANHSAGFGETALSEHLAGESVDPPVLVAQIETAQTDELAELLRPFDVCFVGTTDLSVDLDGGSVPDAVSRIAAGAEAAGVVFGGWAPAADVAGLLGLGDACFLVLGSDLQVLAAGLRRNFDGT